MIFRLSYPPLLRVGLSLSPLSSLVPPLSQLCRLELGLERGFFLRLSLSGTGFRVWSHPPSLLLFDLGYSSLLLYRLPPEVRVVVGRSGALLLLSPYKTGIGGVAAQLRRLRPADPYKGKGVVDPLHPPRLKKRRKSG